MRRQTRFEWPNVGRRCSWTRPGQSRLVGVMTMGAAEGDARSQNVQDCGSRRSAHDSRRASSFELPAPKWSSSLHAGGAAIDSIGPPIFRRAIRSQRSFRLREACPWLVDVIAAGHTHDGLAHQVDGIGIISPSRADRPRSCRSSLRSGPGASRAFALRTAPGLRPTRSHTGNCVPRPNRTCRRSTKEAASRPIRSSSRQWRGAPARHELRQQRSACPWTPRFVESAISVAARKPLCRCAPRRGCRVCRTLRHQQRDGRSSGRFPMAR